MNAPDTLNFYNVITKAFGKKQALTSTNLNGNKATATLADKEGRKWTITCETGETK
jgi:hypothetical protein